jgi:hypothetical protein
MAARRGIVVVIGVAIVAGIAIVAAATHWIYYASPEAKYYLAENAKRDTVEWLAQLSDSVNDAASEPQFAAIRFQKKYARYPRSRSEWSAAGLDTTHLDTIKGAPNSWEFHALHRIPPLGGHATRRIDVGIERTSDSTMRYTPSLWLGTLIIECDTTGHWNHPYRCHIE